MSCADAAATDFQTTRELLKNHQHLRNETRHRLKHLLAEIPSLRDISCDVTPDEIAAEIAIINGESIKVYLTREPYQQLKVIVPRNGSVRDLKVAIRRSFIALQRQRANQSEANDSETPSDEPIQKNISWKYIWRTHYLQSDTDVLVDDERTLREYNIRNKTVLKFVKKIRINRKMQKAKIQNKHR